MALKCLLMIMLVLRILDTCWCREQGTNCSEQTQFELSCHRYVYRNGERLTKYKVLIRPQSENTIDFQLARDGYLESTLVCADGNETVTLAYFRIRGENITCSCLKKFCKLDGAFIESSFGDNYWRSKETLLGLRSDYFRITTTVDRVRDKGSYYRCQLEFRDELTNNLFERYKWISVGMLIGLLIVITLMALAFVHANKPHESPEDSEEE